MKPTLYQAFLSACERYAEKTALIDYHTDLCYSYDHLRLRVARAIRAFQVRCNVQQGDRVGILIANQVEWVVSFFALQALGAVVVPLSYRLSGTELLSITENSGLSGLVTASEHLDVLETVFPHLNWVVFTDKTEVPGVPFPALHYCLDWQANPVEGEADLPAVQTAEDLAVLIYTSGTTGNAKGVMLCHRNLLADADGNARVIEAVEEDVFVTASPLFHVFGLTNVLLTGLLSGAAIVLVRRFNPKSLLEAITNYQVTFLAAVPTMYQMMLTLLPSETYALSSLRVCHSGAAPMHEAVFHEVERVFGAPVQEGYGQSEASSIVTSNPMHGPRKPSSIGKGIPGVTVEIVDDDGQVLPPREVGEVRVSGDTVMLGYWQRPEATAKAVRDGKLYTSDLGYTDEEGYIYLVGRRDDMINVGGAKVYPQEVEEVLYQHPDVKACAVVGEASELYNQVVSAYVVPRDGNELNIADLQKYCRTFLAEYKIPKSIYVVDAIPQGATGKILRHQLKPTTGTRLS